MSSPDRARLIAAGFNTVVAILIVIGLIRMWRASDPRTTTIALTLVPLVPASIALILPQVRWLSLAAAVPNALMFAAGLIYLTRLLSGDLAWFASHAVGITLLLSIGSMNFALLNRQWRTP